MKIIILTIWVGITCSLYGQDVKYSITRDNADILNPKARISLGLFGLDMPNFATNPVVINGINFNAGVYGFYQITENIGIQGDFNYGYLNLDKLLASEKWQKTVKSTQLGVYLLAPYKIKTKSTKITLKQTTKDVGNTRYTLTKSLTLPAKHKSAFGIRGGLYFFNIPYLHENYINPTIEYAKIKHLHFNQQGLYVGIMQRRLTQIHIKTDLYGEVGTNYLIDYFVDAILPFNTNFKLSTKNDLTLNNNGNMQTLKDGDNLNSIIKDKEVLKGLPIGFRAGFILNDPATKNQGGHKYGMSTNFELGYRPYTKWYTKVTLGIQLYKKQF